MIMIQLFKYGVNISSSNRESVFVNADEISSILGDGPISSIIKTTDGSTFRNAETVAAFMTRLAKTRQDALIEQQRLLFEASAEDHLTGKVDEET